MKDQEERRRDKIKEMFKLHRQKLAGNKVEFRLSSLQVIKVPKGWDKLFVVITSGETEKLISKSSKTVVQNGNCVWSESQSLIISQDDGTKELEHSEIKIIVSMGSTRPAILGELLLNLADYQEPDDSGLLSLPLENCESETTLQVRIQYIASQPKSRFRISWKETASRLIKSNNDDMDSKSDVSDGSDNAFARSVASSSSSHLGSTYPDELGNWDTSFTPSGSHQSSDSGHGSRGRTIFFPKKIINGIVHIARQNSAGFRARSNIGAGSLEVLSKSNASSFNSRASGSSILTNQWQENSPNELTLVKETDSTKELFEASEEIEELRDEVKMWERHSRELKLDIGKLRKEIADNLKHQAEQNMEISATCIERDSLKQEVDKLRILMHESMKKQANTCSDRIKDILDLKKELEEEVKFQRECNANLSLQLKKTQESNIEFVSLLQELESIIEKQGMEIERYHENKGHIEVGSTKCSDGHSDLLEENKVLRLKVQELERECTELTDENLSLIFKINKLGKDIKKENCMLDAGPTDFEGHISSDEEPQTASLIQRMEFKKVGRKENKVIISSTTLRNLENRFHMLEVELQGWKAEACDLRNNTQNLQLESKEKILELSELKPKLEVAQQKCLDLSEIHERRSLEFENCKAELELHISNLEQKNLQFSDTITGLEDQLGYVTNEKESNRQELEDCRSLIIDLKEEIERQNVEIQMQRVELMQKVQDTQVHTSKALEESDIFRQSNSKLQATVERVVEECNSLHKLIADLKGEKLELQERATLLETELEHSQKKNHEFDREIGLLDAKFSSIQKVITSKESSMLSQLEKLLDEHQEHAKKLTHVNVVLNKIELAKTREVEKLQREILSSHDEEIFFPIEVMRETSILDSDKAKLECSVKETDKRVKWYEKDIKALCQETKTKIQCLDDFLNASKFSEQMLLADIKYMQRLLASVKSNEEEFRKLANELELKLQYSDHEKQQIMEETSLMKAPLQNISHVEDEIVILKQSMDETMVEKENLEASLKSVSEECEELKRDRDSLIDTVSNMQKAVNNVDNDRHTQVALEEKLPRLESDLLVKETLCKTQLMEKELLLENEPNGDNKTYNESIMEQKDQTQEAHSSVVDKESKVDQLDLELRDVYEEKDENECHLERSLEDNQIDLTQDLKENGNINCIAINNSGRTSELESELKDMKERYLQMSLQYAEVEAQREELVLQLKSVKKDKKWFS